MPRTDSNSTCCSSTPRLSSAPYQIRVLEGIIALAEHTGVSLVAEGIETLRQMNIMRRLGIDWMQGFLFGPPFLPVRARQRQSIRQQATLSAGKCAMDDQPSTVPTLDALARAAVRIFRPLVRIMLRNNVSYKTCAEWLRWCYADVAYNDFALPGRKQSKSRVAVLTGLTRVDVNQILAQQPPDSVPQQEQYHRAGLVLTGWANDPEFSAEGKPMKRLPFEADDDAPSFSKLVSRHSGGAPARAVLDELERNGAVRVLTDRTIELIRTWYIGRPAKTDINYAEIFGMSCGDLIETIGYNWAPENDHKRLQLLVYNRSIHPELVGPAKEKLESAARELAEQVDHRLCEFEKESEKLPQHDASRKTRLGLGLYYFESEDSPSID